VPSTTSRNLSALYAIPLDCFGYHGADQPHQLNRKEARKNNPLKTFNVGGKGKKRSFVQMKSADTMGGDGITNTDVAVQSKKKYKKPKKAKRRDKITTKMFKSQKPKPF